MHHLRAYAARIIMVPFNRLCHSIISALLCSCIGCFANLGHSLWWVSEQPGAKRAALAALMVS